MWLLKRVPYAMLRCVCGGEGGMRRNRYSKALIGLALLASAGQAQDNAPVPINAVGEEVFGKDYVPSAPAEEAVPLEPGRPAAGVQLPAFGLSPTMPSVFSRSEIKRGDEAARNVPLLRNVRREKRLRRFKHQPVPGFSAAPTAPATTALSAAELKVHFVNVGQGAGAILEFPCHTAVIDTGGEYAKGVNSVNGGKLFADYLDRFFKERPLRKRVIDLVITSHPHEDHLAGLAHISSATGANAYTVKNVVDNGQTHPKGSLADQKAFRVWATMQTPKALYSFVNFKSAITATGVTNSVIDPIGPCPGESLDPIITILWGAHNEKVATGGEDWINPNNHSLVVRVDYGDASFLFVGDLEDVGAKEMLREYEDNLDVFDVHVYHVSHHGAGNDTFDDFLEKISPAYAILSMGKPDARGSGSAWAHGHPRLKAIDAMQKTPIVVDKTRPGQPFAVATAVRKFKQVPITKAIYGTAWEGTIVMTARADGTITIAE
jgi:beta-lactamase superfamily II metal-dependent hydrolase